MNYSTESMYGTYKYIQLNINAPSFIFHPHMGFQSMEKCLGRSCYRSEHPSIGGFEAWSVFYWAHIQQCVGDEDI